MPDDLPAPSKHSRRAFLSALSASLGLAFLPRPLGALAAKTMLTKPIPASGAALPIIGIGSWINFNVGRDLSLRQKRLQVLKAFFEGGGALIDSSPMYGSSEEVIGYMLHELNDPGALFAATKVWTAFEDQGLAQIKHSMKLWGVERFELLQIHNLLAWQGHLKTLRALKEEGLVRYIGITTSHGRRHEDFAAIMKSEPLDFVQLTYNMDDREAERTLLPLALDKGIAVIANRPFQRGALIDRFAAHPLPDFAREIDCANWPQFLLKFIVGHPAITATIPATTRVDHVRENVGAGYGRLPTQKMRAEMAAYCAAL